MSKQSERLPKRVWASEITQKMIRPVPLDVWRMCVRIFESAATLRMPTKNPSEFKVQIGKTTYAFEDQAQNRGMFAVREFLHDQREYFPAVMARIWAVLELMDDERVRAFLKEDLDEADGPFLPVMMDAIASAPFEHRTLSLDLDALLALTQQSTQGG